MVGWLFTNHNGYTGNFEKHIVYKDWFFGYTSNGKFGSDKLFFENEKWVVCLDGIVLNKSDLQKGTEWGTTVLNMFEHSSFPNTLRGSFNGFIFSKEDEEATVFVDHLGERAVFYSETSNVCVSSNFNMINELYNTINKNKQLDKTAVKYMLTFGYMIDNSTYISDVKRMMPGTKIHIKYNKNDSKPDIESESFHIFTSKNQTNDTDEQIIEKLDSLFRTAVSLAMEKDIEYGKKSLIDLSGGLDCRVVNFVAKDMGYDNIVNISFSQSGSDEYRSMMMLSHELKNDLIYLPLDNANFIKDLEITVSLNYGLSLYSGATAINRIIEYLDFQNFGIEHGGLLGDMHDGAMPGEDYFCQEPPSFKRGMRFSSILPNTILDESVLNQYENNEIFTMIGRGIFAGYSTVMIRHNEMEFLSPFGNVDFYDYFLSIPLTKRVKEKIMQKWVEKRYPNAFKVVYDKTMCRINDNKAKIFIKSFMKKVVGRIKYYCKIPNINNMNPFDYWYKTNKDFAGFIDDYYNNNVHIVEQYTELYELMDLLFKKGSVRDKSMVLTALAAIKKYFYNVDSK